MWYANSAFQTAKAQLTDYTAHYGFTLTFDTAGELSFGRMLPHIQGMSIYLVHIGANICRV